MGHGSGVARTPVVDTSPNPTSALPAEAFRELFDLALAGIRVVDLQGLLVFTNPRLAQLLGTTTEALTHRSAWERVAPEDLEAAQHGWGRRLAGLSETYPCRWLRADGSRLATLVSASPIMGEQGTLTGVLEIVTPLAELNPASAAEPSAEAQSAAVLQGLRDGVWLTNAQDLVVYANPALGELLARPLTSIRGQRGDQEFPPDPSRRFHAAYAEARATRQPVRFESLALADGAGRSLLVSGWLIPQSRAGSYDGMIGTATDVTGRRREETVTAGKLEHLERVLGHLAAPLIVWNAARRVSQVNHAFERITGYRPADLLGRELGLLFPSAYRPEVLAKLGRWSPEEPVQLVETPVLRRDGQERIFHWSVTVIPSAEGATPLATVAFVQDVTERRLLAQAAERDESGYRRLADTMRVGLWVIRADATTSAANPFVTELLGNHWEQLAQRPFHERVTPEHLPLMQQAWGRWLAGVSETLECRFLRRGGGFCDCLLSAAPLTDESGQVASVVLTLTDISEAKRREAALRESESALRIAAENLPGGFLLLEVDGRIRTYNQTAAQMARAVFGRELEPGKSMYLVVAEQALDDFNRHFQQAHGGQVVETELALPVGGEPEQIFELRYAPVGSLGGHPAGVLLTLHDLTASRQREQREQEEREAVRRRSAVAWQQANSVNRVAEVFLTAARALAGADFGGLYLADPESGELVLVAALEVPAGVQSLAGRLRSPMPGWKRAHAATPVFATVWELVGAEISPEAAQNAELLGLIPIHRETPQDAWLLAGFTRPRPLTPATVAALESLAAEAGGALRRLEAEESWRQSQGTGPSAAEWQRQIFERLAHECRTPAAVAVGAAELLFQHPEDLSVERRQELLELVLESSRRLASLLDGLGSLGQQASPPPTTTSARVDLCPLVQRVLADAQAGDAAGHLLRFACATPQCEAAVDGPAVGQILRALVDNALRYSPPGTPVDVTIEAGGGGILLAVDDGGRGVPEADRKRIFEPFERGSNVGETAGAGLGLALASRLAQAQGGSLQWVPKTGAGARFVCQLPVRG